ncbi:hypothetical protein ACX80E_06835 [Arthrobacter sp. TMN-49]
MSSVPLRGLAGSARRAVMAIAASVALGTLLAGPATGAETTNDLLELSGDGVHFAADAPPTMFRSTKGYVPGESRQGLIWVRNASNHSAQLSVGAHNTANAGAAFLPGYLRLQTHAPSHSPTAATLPFPGACTPVINGWTLAAGEVLPLTLALGLTLQAPNSTRNQAADFTLMFVLQERGAGELVGPCSGRPDTPPAAGAALTLPVSGGTAGTVEARLNGTVTGRTQAAEGAVNGAETASGAPPVAGPGPAEQQGVLAAREPQPLLRRLQSNVEATAHNPWPWLALISACVYVFTSVRKRSRTR